MKKDIKGYEGRYFVTEQGEVYSSKIKKPMKPNDNGTGYLSVELYSKDGTSKRKYIHRLVAEAFVPNPFCAPVVNHKNADTRDNRAGNLEWMFQDANIAHSRKLGNQNKDRAVKATDIDTGEAYEFLNFRDAERRLLNGRDIIRRHTKRKGRIFNYGGYAWEVLG